MKKYQRYVLSIGLSICLLAPGVSWAESFRLLRNYPDRMPLSFMDGKGQPTGFETELMAEIVKRSGLSLNEEFVPSIRHGLQALREGEADLLVAAVSITEERKKEFDFSEEYFLSRPMIITKDSSIKSFTDLADKKVGMIQDSVHERRIRAVQEGTEQEGSTLGRDTIFLALKDMLQGKSAAIVGGESYMAQIPSLYEKYQLTAVFDDSFAQDHYAIAIRKGNDNLRLKINVALQQMKEDGALQRLTDKWYGQKKL